MNPTYYEGETTPEVAQEEIKPQRRFRQFQGWIHKNFVVVLDGQWINVLYVFRQYLLDLSSAIFAYLCDRPKLNAVTKKCTFCIPGYRAQNLAAGRAQTGAHVQGPPQQPKNFIALVWSVNQDLS